MQRPSAYPLLALLPLALAGCATSSLEMAPRRADGPWVPATTANGAIIPGETTTTKSAAQSETEANPKTNGQAGYALPANATLASVPAPPDIDHDHAYSLAELIDIAQSNNSLTRIAWDTAREAALAAGIARSTYLPNLTASVVAGHQSSHNNRSVLGFDVNGETTANGTVSALSLRWLLFDFGERSAILNAAKQASVISNIGFTATHQQVIYAVSVAYYTEAAARARVANAERFLKNAQNVEIAAQERHTHGIGTVIEVSQAHQATAQAQLLQVQAEGAAADTYQALLAAMGISPLTRIKIADIPERKLPGIVPDAVEQIVADALGRRPDVLAAYATQQASLDNVQAARAEFLPKLFVSATGAYASGHLDLTAIPGLGQQPSTVNLSGNQFGLTVFAGVTVPLYDGGLRAAVLEQARAKVDKANAALAHTREEAVRQIVVAQNALRTSLSAYSASTELNAAAETTFEASLAAYRNGVGSITDTTLAESQLLQARNAQTDTYSSTLSASATLALAVGSLSSAPQ